MHYKTAAALQKIAARAAVNSLYKTAGVMDGLRSFGNSVSNAYNGAVNAIADTAPMRWAGKKLSRGMSDEQRRNIDKRLEMQRASMQRRGVARRALSLGLYADPRNIIGPDAAERRKKIGELEREANTRVTYSGRTVPMNPKKSYSVRNTPTPDSGLWGQPIRPGEMEFTVARERALNSLGPTRYMNPANIFGPDAKARRDAIENDERLANSIFLNGQIEPIDNTKPWADPDWLKKFPINME